MKYISPRGIALGCFTFILLFQSPIAHAEIIACNLTRRLVCFVHP